MRKMRVVFAPVGAAITITLMMSSDPSVVTCRCIVNG